MLLEGRRESALRQKPSHRLLLLHRCHHLQHGVIVERACDLIGELRDLAPDTVFYVLAEMAKPRQS